VQVFTPADLVTLSIVPTIPSPFQFFISTYVNFPSVTATLATAPSGFSPVSFPFTVEVVPSPSPSPTPSGPTGGIQVIGS
jgi:hypothetical protein